MDRFNGLLDSLNEGMSSPNYKEQVVAAEDFVQVLQQHVEEAAEQYYHNFDHTVDASENSPFTEVLVSELPRILQSAFSKHSPHDISNEGAGAPEVVAEADDDGVSKFDVGTESHQYSLTMDEVSGLYTVEQDGKVITTVDYSGDSPTKADITSAEDVSGALIDVLSHVGMEGAEGR